MVNYRCEEVTPAISAGAWQSALGPAELAHRFKSGSYWPPAYGPKPCHGLLVFQQRPAFIQ
jgi:hypothetical protein